jgi:hypothetical protein
MLPNWLYGKSKTKLATILGGGGGTPADYNQVKAQVTQNTEDIALLSDALDDKAAKTQITNPNLLDNPWFTINQRGFVSTSNSGEYTVDRWRSAIESGASGTISLSNGIMTISSTSGKIFLVQRVTLDDLKALIGKRITVSLLLSDDTIISGTGLYSGETLPYINNDDVFIYTSSATGVNGLVNIQVHSGKSISVKALKLELGSISTLAMDTAPNYATELLKCQRYFHKYATEALRPSNMYDCVPEMRATPTQSTITIDSTAYYVNSADL